jgi:hypothetical protein
MTTINNSLAAIPLDLKAFCINDKTTVVLSKDPGVLKRTDSLTLKSSFGTVPANEKETAAKKEFGSAYIKVIAELTSSGLNLASPKIVTAAKTGGATGQVIGKIMPGLVSGINVGITVLDSHDSYKKLINSNVSLPSKAFSVATVGLDLVTVVAHHAGNSKTAALASVASIGTSIASDYFKEK